MRHAEELVAALTLLALAAPVHGQGGLGAALQGRQTSIGQTAGELEVLAQEQDFDEATQTYVFDGDVELRQQNVFSLEASRVVYYHRNGWLHAEGPVQLTAGRDVLSGNAATYNVQTGRAKVYNAHAVLDPSLIVEARTIEKLSPHPRTGSARFFIEQGTFTACHRPGTGWRLRANSALVHTDNFLHLYGVWFEVRGVPLFYLPYYVQSIKRERTTGFLPPRFGVDSFWGTFLFLEFFWAITDALDMSFEVRSYGGTVRVDGLAILRFRLDPRDPINVVSVHHARFPDESRRGAIGGAEAITFLAALLNHTFRHDLNLTAKINLQSNRLPNDPTQSLEDRARQFSTSEAGLSKNFGSQSVRLNGYFAEGSVPGGVVPGSFGNDQSRFEILPRLIYSSGTPWRLIGDALQLVIPELTIDRLRRRDQLFPGSPVIVDRSLWHMHARPTLQGTITLPGVSVQPTLSLLETYWSDRRELDPNFPETFATYPEEVERLDSEPGAFIGHVGDGLFRHVYESRVFVTGPSFYRLYSTDARPEGKLKHLVQPVFVYVFMPFVDQTEVLDLEINRQRLEGRQHGIGYGLSNVLLYKWRDQTTPTEVFRFDINHGYAFLRDIDLQRTPTLRAAGDLSFNLQVRLPQHTLSGIVRIEPYDWRVRYISVTAAAGRRLWGVSVDYYRTALLPFDATQPSVVDRHSVTGAARLRLGQRWQLQGRGVYNLVDDVLADGVLEIGYRSQCWGLSLGAGMTERKFLTGPEMFETDRNVAVSFSVHLLNLGSLGTTQQVR